MGNKKKDIENSHDDYMLYSYDKQAARIDHFKEIAYDKGFEQGMKIGRVIGLKQVIAERLEQIKIETAKKLYESNASMDIIKTATGFNEKQIRNICL